MDRNSRLLAMFILVHVALRKESVDRNLGTNTILFTTAVALRKESVDRNAIVSIVIFCIMGRSPQGERG